MSDNQRKAYQLWHYTPSLPGGIIACIAFLALALFHTYRLVRTRYWACIPFVVGGFCTCLPVPHCALRSLRLCANTRLVETIGYAARAAAHSDTETIGPYVTQSLLILLAPILFAASVYMILGRIVRSTDGARYLLVRVKWVTKIFVAGDVFCFLMQSTGGGLMATADDQDGVDMGENIILGGLILQIVVFGFFVAVAGVWHRRMRANPPPKSFGMGWERYMWVLYAVSALITVRNVARCVEYGMGRVSLLLRMF